MTTEIEKLTVEASVMSEMMRQGRLIATGKDARMVDRLIAALQHLLEANNAMQAERDRVDKINSALSRDKNTLLVDGANWQRRAEAAVATLTAQVEAMRGELELHQRKDAIRDDEMALKDDLIREQGQELIRARAALTTEKTNG